MSYGSHWTFPQELPFICRSAGRSALVRGTAGFALAASETPPDDSQADYTLTIATKPIELAPKHIVSITTYNGQSPGPLLRFKEGERVIVDVHNDTDTPEQLLWHGHSIPSDIYGAAVGNFLSGIHLRHRSTSRSHVFVCRTDRCLPRRSKGEPVLCGQSWASCGDQDQMAAKQPEQSSFCVN
jgi:hypothetical protein